MDIEFEEERCDGRGGSLFRREGYKHISFFLQEIEEEVCGQRRSETFSLRREEENVIICSLAVLEEGEVARFRGIGREVETAC